MSEAPYQGPLLSADSHVVEPRDLWVKRMDAKWRDRAPRIEGLDGLGRAHDPQLTAHIILGGS